MAKIEADRFGRENDAKNTAELIRTTQLDAGLKSKNMDEIIDKTSQITISAIQSNNALAEKNKAESMVRELELKN